MNRGDVVLYGSRCVAHLYICNNNHQLRNICLPMSETAHRYFILNKPYNMVSQFVSSHDVVLLGDIDFPFPEGTHAIGRLDNHSEGLLLLTTNKTVTKRLFQGEVEHTRTYLVHVKYAVTPGALQTLRTGVSIQVKGGEFYTTRACNVELVEDPSKYVQVNTDQPSYQPSSWLLMTLTEGKFHQVRKMVNAVGHKCKRLIRISIEDITLGDLQPSEVREINEDDFFKLLKIPN
jgi:23S rRNA pseudouridine2457 synthase